MRFFLHRNIEAIPRGARLETSQARFISARNNSKCEVSHLSLPRESLGHHV